MPSSVKDYRKLIEQPWGRMFYEMIYRQLSIPESPRLNILDYGAGFCLTANHYAKNHNVTAVEPNNDMLNMRIKDNDFTLINGDIKILNDMPSGSFDLVLCHNVLEYVSDKGMILKQLTRVLKQGGKLSIVKHNLEGRILAYAVFGDDPESALELLSKSRDDGGSMFGSRDTYGNDYLINNSDKLGLIIDNIYGIRAFFALSSNDKIKYTDEWYDNMLELEMRACDIDAYKNIAFFNHLIFTKNIK